MSKKKTAIIVSATVAILAILAVTGTVVFLKDRGSTEAADLETETGVSGNQVATDNESSVLNTQEDAIAGTDGETAGAEETTIEGGVEGTGVGTGDADEGETTTIGGAGTTVGTETIEETTITRTEEVEIPERKIAEGHYVGWTPMNIEAEIASANIVAEKEELEVIKKADEKVAQGDEVTYEITVKNKTDEDVKNIEVKDRLDTTILDITTVVFVIEKEDTANLITIPGKIEGNVITWNVNIKAGETITIIFKATVKTNIAQGTILKNTVVANGIELEKPTETEITEATKNITVEKVWTGDEEVAENVRPSNLTINLENNAKAELTAENAVEGKANVWSKVIEVDKYDDEGNEIIYSYLNETTTSENANKFASYTEKSVDQTEKDVVKVTNEYKAPEVTKTEIKKDGTDVITSKDQEVVYTINYKTTVKDYKGDATVTIVDTLPYAIDLEKSDIANGTYNAENKTITWTEKVSGIDTYTNGEKEINVSKTIKVVYVDMDVTDGSFVNKAEGTLKLDEINKDIPTDPTEKETEQNFKKDITVIKEWVGDAEVAENVRPSDITISLEHNKSATMTSANAVEGKANEWKTKITVDKYNVDGTDKVYGYKGETSTDANKLANYKATVDESVTDTVKVTNTYKAPEVEKPEIKKDGTDVITSKDHEVEYTINYKATVKDYKGDATVTIVDTLPYGIDLQKSDIANGTYNAENKTITWTEKVAGIDTYTNGEKEISVSKTIKVVYVDMDVTDGSFVNKAEGTLKLDEINKEVPTDPAEKETEQNFKKDITVIKEWVGDEEVANKVRPSNITINLDYNQSATMTSANAVEGKANEWKTKITVDKYNADGTDKVYEYKGETSTDTNKFANYTEKVVDQTEKDVVKVTNEYKAPEVTTNKVEKTGTELITSKDDKVEYQITYNAIIKDYKGDAKVTLVDTLPYEIDTNNAEIKLDAGEYDAQNKTITWVEEIKGLDTYAEESKVENIQITKNIVVVFKNIDVTKTEFVNKVNATLKLETNNEEYKPEEDTHTTEQNFKKDITVIKEWVGDNEEVRPTEITINLENNKSVTLTSANATTTENIWQDVIKDVEKYNNDGTEKTYKYVSETTTEANANKLANYTATVNERTENTVKVTNTYKAPEVTTNQIAKTGTDKITEKDGVVTYQITYNATVKDYKGDAVVTIVDTLPYEIDTTKSYDIAGGTYNAENKTITWTQNIEGIDTFGNENRPKEIEIIKNITVVYKDVDVKAKNFVNIVNATLKLNTNNEEYGPVEDEKTTEIDFTKDLTIIKVWSGDKEAVRPSDLTINVTNGKSATLTNNNKTAENTWQTTINDVEKYDENGNTIDYNYVLESSTTPDKLLNYTASSSKDGDTITVTNTYNAPNTTVNKVEKTGTEKITSKEDVVTYTINYTATVRDYKGTAVVTVIDQLPFEVDLEKAYDFNGGVYNKDNKTITWTETIEAIDTFSKENKEQTISFSKTILVVFKNMDVTAGKFENNVTASLKLNETDPIPADPDKHETEQDFKKDITVEKIWNRDSASVRPAELTINLSNGKTITLTSENAKDSKTWSGVIEGVDKYDATTGNEITYTFVNETSTDEKFNDYTRANVDETVKDTIKVTNNYKTTNLTGTKTWDDKENIKGERPESIQVALKQIVGNDKVAVLDTQGKEIVQTVNKQENTDGTIKNEWQYTFENLPIFDENGNEVHYTVEELNVKTGYVATVNGIDITNKYDVNQLQADKTIEGVKPVTSESGNFVTVVPTQYKVAEGDEIKYKIEVTNTGNTDLTEVIIKDNKKVTLESIEVPEGMNKENVELNEYEANTNIVANLTGTLKVNEKITLYVTLKVEKGLIINTGDLTNTVVASAKNTPEDDGEATIGVVESPSATIEKTSTLVNGKAFNKETTKLQKGNVVTYELKVTNTGNVTLENVNITDDRKVTYNGKTYNPGEKLLGANGITLEPEATHIITVTYTVTQDDLENQNAEKTLINWAKVIVTEDGKDVEYDKDDDTLNEIEATPNLVNQSKSIKVNGVASKTGTTVELGDLITYTISVTNNGTKKATEVKVEDYVPAGTEFVSAEGTPTVETRADGKEWRTWTVDVPAGETVSVSFTVKVKNAALGTTIENTGKVNETNTNTIENDTKTELNIYQVDSIGQGQKAVVVIDMSLSMASAVAPDIDSDTMAYLYTDTRWYHLKTAIDTFVTNFLANGKNQIAIVGYNSSATTLTGYTNNAEVAKGSYSNVFTQTHFDNLQKAAGFGSTIYNAQHEGSFTTNLDTKNGKYVIDVDALTYLGDGKWNANAQSGGTRVQKDQLITGATETTECRLGSGTNIAAGLVSANTILGNQEVTYTSVILMTDGENNRSVSGTTISGEAYKINKTKKADLYTIGFTNDVKTLTDHVGTTNITKSFTATTSSDLYAAFDELEDEINDLPVVTKVTDKTGKVDLSDYASLDLKTVVFYKGATATGDNILKSYTGAEFKALLISGQFDLAAFINSDEVKDKLTETDTINVEIVVNK